MRAESERQEPARRPPGTTGPQCMPQRRIVEGAGTLLPTFLDMRLLTGDEVGLLKVTAVRTDALAPLPSKKLKSSLPAAKQAKADAAAAGDGAAPERARPLTQTRILGRVDRANGIQLLARASLDPNVVVVARASGIVECIDVDSGAVLRWHKCFTPMPEPAPAEPSRSSHRAAKPYRPEHFIGLHEHNGTVIAATDRGNVFYLNAPGSEAPALPSAVASLGQDRLCSMRVHPKYPHIFATGGDERDLCIWDIRRLFCSADGTVPLLEGEEASLPADPAGARKRKGKKANAEAELLNEADSDASHPPAEPVSGDGGEPANSIPVLEPLWEAKNVRNDFLDMRVPVWITTIEWLSTETYTRLVTGTGHHQVRVFDTKKQRRPILDVSVGDHPVRAMAVNASKTEVLLADTTGQMVSISIDTGKVTGKFLGIAGAVAQIHACERSDVVISVGIDRKARLFEGTGKRRILREIYLKQRLSALLVDENWVDNSPDEQEEASGNDGSAESTTSVKRGRNGAAGGGSDADDEDDDAMWDGIPVVGQDDGRSADTKSARANKSAKAAKASKAAKPAKAPKNAWQVADRPAPDGASAGAAAKKQRKA